MKISRKKSSFFTLVFASFPLFGNAADIDINDIRAEYLYQTGSFNINAGVLSPLGAVSQPANVLSAFLFAKDCLGPSSLSANATSIVFSEQFGMPTSPIKAGAYIVDCKNVGVAFDAGGIELNMVNSYISDASYGLYFDNVEFSEFTFAAGHVKNSSSAKSINGIVLNDCKIGSGEVFEIESAAATIELNYAGYKSATGLSYTASAGSHANTFKINGELTVNIGGTVEKSATAIGVHTSSKRFEAGFLRVNFLDDRILDENRIAVHMSNKGANEFVTTVPKLVIDGKESPDYAKAYFGSAINGSIVSEGDLTISGSIRMGTYDEEFLHNNRIITKDIHGVEGGGRLVFSDVYFSVENKTGLEAKEVFFSGANIIFENEKSQISFSDTETVTISEDTKFYIRISEDFSFAEREMHMIDFNGAKVNFVSELMDSLTDEAPAGGTSGYDKYIGLLNAEGKDVTEELKNKYGIQIDFNLETGSIKFTSNVPEPAEYAAAFGAFALFGVLVSRKPRK